MEAGAAHRRAAPDPRRGRSQAGGWHDQRSVHECPDLRRNRRARVPGRGPRPGQPHLPHRARGPGAAHRGGHHGGRRRRHPDARPRRGAHPLLLERPARPQRDPAHAHRGAHPLVCPHRQALPRHGLHLLHRRGHRQAPPRRRDQERHRVGPDPGSAVPGGEPGDHGAGRPGRRDAAAPAVPRVQLRGRRQRARGDAEDGAHVPQVRSGHRQAERLGGVHRGDPGRVHADDRGGDRGRGQGGARAASGSRPTRGPRNR
jgi:hypothetical protein